MRVVSRSRHRPQNTGMVKEEESKEEGGRDGRGREVDGRREGAAAASKNGPSQVKVYVTIYTILNRQGGS